MARPMTIKQAVSYTVKMGRGGSYKKPLKICNQIMLSGVRKNFNREETPDGRRWPPLDPKTLKRRRGSRAQILRDRSDLFASTTATNAMGAIRKLTDRRGVIGSVLDYARTHDQGDPRRGIKQRAFIGHRPENLPKYDEVFAENEEGRAEDTNG